jgi:diamine N-acetyltransferase
MSLRKDLETLNFDCWKNDLIKIKSLTTEKELIYAAYECQLTEEQKEMVSPLWFIIGRAYLNKDNYFPCIIYTLDDKPIGFISFSSWLGNSEAYSWSYFIDLKYQGKGYGKSAAELAIKILKKAAPYKSIKLATEKNNTKAHKLYSSLGFSKSSEMDGEDLVFVL